MTSVLPRRPRSSDPRSSQARARKRAPRRLGTAERVRWRDRLAARRPELANNRINRIIIVAMVVVTLLVAVATVAVPGQAYLDSRDAVGDLYAELRELRSENARLEDRREALGTPEEIERLARSEYDLVYPHEEAYAVLPPPARTPAFFHAWPY